MSLPRSRFLLRVGTRVDAAISTVETDAAFIVIGNLSFVDIVIPRHIHVIHRTVIEKAPILPTAPS
jgi:hypothetical protein